MWIYSGVLGLGLVLASPWWLLRMVTTERYREGLRQRLGAVPATLRAAVAGKRVVWVHAVSVGEVLAVSRLVGELEAALNVGKSGASKARPGAPAPTLTGSAGEDGAPGAWVVVVSTTTRTGQALARERFGAERVFYLPLDFAWAVRAYLRVLRPAMVVLAESELWPRMLHECARAGVPVAVVNARVSDRSFRRAMRVRWVWARVLGKVTLFLAQSAEDARRLVALGARATQVSGNLKYDVRAPGENAMARLLQTALGDRPVVVAGSTVASADGRKGEAEEKQLAEAWAVLRQSFPRAVLVVAPRHPERFQAAAEALAGCGLVRATDLAEVDDMAFESGLKMRMGEGSVVLLDTVGDLASVYSLATVAFVGGSLVQAGGHNPLEPARFGVPVVMGPSFENFRDVVSTMEKAEAIHVAKDRFEVAAVMRQLLAEPQKARAMGGRGRQVFEREGGATARSIEALMVVLGAQRDAVDEASAAVRA